MALELASYICLRFAVTVLFSNLFLPELLSTQYTAVHAVYLDYLASPVHR